MIRNLPWLRSLVFPSIPVQDGKIELPQIGAKLYEIITDLDKQHTNVQEQVNGSGNSQPLAPPGIGGVKVTAANGHFRISITDNSPIYRGIQYHVEHADNPQFTNAEPIDLGASREHRIFLGNATTYWRAASSYYSSPTGPWVYFGNHAQPTGVQGGGETGAGPAYGNSQGSGTGPAGAGLQGPGVAPFRAVEGLPPKR